MAIIIELLLVVIEQDLPFREVFEGFVDQVKREHLWNVLDKYGVNQKLLKCIDACDFMHAWDKNGAWCLELGDLEAPCPRVTARWKVCCWDYIMYVWNWSWIYIYVEKLEVVVFKNSWCIVISQSNKCAHLCCTFDLENSAHDARVMSVSSEWTDF